MVGYLPAFSCCFEADAASCRDASSVICLKTTGARDIVPGVEAFARGSRRFAYNERAPFAGLFKFSGPIRVSGGATSHEMSLLQKEDYLNHSSSTIIINDKL